MVKCIIIVATLSLHIMVFCNEDKIQKAIMQRDHATVQKLLQGHTSALETRGLLDLQPLGRDALQRLYTLADEQQQNAQDRSKTYLNSYVLARLTKTAVFAAGAGYQVAKIAIEWNNYRNWTDILVGIAMGFQGFSEFYDAITNNDAKTELAKAQLIAQLLQNNTQSGTITVDDLEQTT